METPKKKKETEDEEKDEKETAKREIVVPGEVIVSGQEFLPGEGTARDGKDIISLKFGLIEKTDRLIKVISLTGAYIPRIGNTVVGQIVDVTFNGWVVDVLSPQLAFLPASECMGRVDKNDLTEFYDFRDTIVTKIKSVKSRGADLTMRDHGLRKLEGGLITRINPTRVPRIIGRGGSMVNTIKEITGCNIIVGQNGIIWIRGRNVDEEMLAKEAIELIVKKPFIDGLTEKVKDFLLSKTNKKAEYVENTD